MLFVTAIANGSATCLANERPNVVIFLADDAGWGDYSHSGNKQVSTSHIDSIATSGVSFDRFFVCPVCAPTRAEFLTGRYHPRGGVRGVSTGQERLDLSERTLPEAFKAAGYATGAFGKWHNGSQWPYHPKARGFDEYFGYTAGHWGEYFDPVLEDDNGQMVRAKGYIVDICTDRAIKFIAQHTDAPFLCYIPFTTPHSPWAVPDEDWKRFQNRPIEQTATIPKEEEVEHTRCALAMLENQDRNVGRVLKTLREQKLDRNTIVLYFSDNGPNTPRWNGGMKGKKGGTDDGGIRSVCYLSWPGRLPAGRSISQIAGAIDLLPTLTHLAGVAPVGTKPLDGRDLGPLIFEEKPSWPERMLFSTWAGKFSVRSQTHRLDDQGRLYNMVEDPGQQTPINELAPETAAKMKAALASWRDKMFGVNQPSSPAAIAPTKLDQPTRKPTVDPRPFTVGYREFPITHLPARDGEPLGGVRRSSSAPNSSYFVNWTSTDDKIEWFVDVHTSGTYDVTIDYTCIHAGSLIELSSGEHRLTGRVTPAWNPPLYTNQDTLPRPPGESQLKEFHPLALGTIELDAGQSKLVLRAIEIPGKSVMDVRRVTLTLRP